MPRGPPERVNVRGAEYRKVGFGVKFTWHSDVSKEANHVLPENFDLEVGWT